MPNQRTECRVKEHDGTYSKLWFETRADVVICNDSETVEDKLKNISNVQSKTYSELKVLKDSNQLKTGQKYLLTDYVTKYQQPSTNKLKVGKYDLSTITSEQIVEETEPLLLTAISDSEFAVECYSPMFPDDVIYYDFDNSVCEDKATPRNGFILRRYFVKNEINVPNDWRKIKWARYEKDYGVAGILLTYDSSGTYKGEYYTFDFNGVEGSSACNNIEIDGATGSLCDTVWAFDLETGSPANITCGVVFRHNTFRDKCNNNTFASSCSGNSFSSSCSGNSFSSSCSGNAFSSGCGGNVFASGCRNNTFGSSCYDNTFGSNCHDNTFGERCFSNTFGSSCTGNTFGNRCYQNSLSSNSHSNIFGSECHSNTFGTYCFSNNFIDGCSGNTTGTDFFRNSFGSDCRDNTFGSNCGNNTLGDNAQKLFVKYMYWKDISNIADLKSKSYTNTIEQMSNGQYCYWYKTGTSYSNVTTVQIP